jgi:hypothetical protein
VRGLRLFDQILKSLRQGLLDILRYEAVAQRVVAIVVAEGDGTQFVDEIEAESFFSGRRSL